MIYLFPARTRVLPAGRDDLFFPAEPSLRVLFFSAPPRLRGEPALPSPTNAARTHTTGGSPSVMARQDFPSSLEP